jgi:HEPN domain-containing protein
VNRSDFQRLARIRLREAGVLLVKGCYEGAYYLGGHAVECALKACIAKKTRRFDFPERDANNKYYVHNLEKLALAAGPQLAAEFDSSSGTKANWAIVAQWTHESRYALRTRQEAENLIKAVSNQREGVLRCLRRHW